jgi:hypothetical protein
MAVYAGSAGSQSSEQRPEAEPAAEGRWDSLQVRRPFGPACREDPQKEKVCFCSCMTLLGCRLFLNRYMNCDGTDIQCLLVNITVCGVACYLLGSLEDPRQI